MFSFSFCHRSCSSVPKDSPILIVFSPELSLCYCSSDAFEPQPVKAIININSTKMKLNVLVTFVFFIIFLPFNSDNIYKLFKLWRFSAEFEFIAAGN
jgi:hypothetical protein